MKIIRTENDMDFNYKFIGKIKELNAFYNLVFRNKMFNGSTSGMHNKPDADGNYYITIRVYKWDVEKAEKIIKDCTGIAAEQFELI